MNITFIGLGAMGFPMAGHLAQRSDLKITVYNRTQSKAESWVSQYDGQYATSLVEAVRYADIVFSCVGNDEDLREITLDSNGILDALPKGGLYVDHSTTSANIARELYEEALKRGLQFLDAPVSGGQQGAEQGVLSVMLGGDDTAFQRVKPIIACYAKTQKLMGSAGSGQLTKMVNQICVAGLLQGLSEAMHFAKATGIEPDAILDVISKGAAQSWQMDNRALTMCEGKFDFGFAVDWMRKDLAYVIDEAKKNGSHLPVTELVDRYYSEVQVLGGGRWDTSSLITRLDHIMKR